MAQEWTNDINLIHQGCALQFGLSRVPSRMFYFAGRREYVDILRQFTVGSRGNELSKMLGKLLEGKLGS